MNSDPRYGEGRPESFPNPRSQPVQKPPSRQNSGRPTSAPKSGRPNRPAPTQVQPKQQRPKQTRPSNTPKQKPRRSEVRTAKSRAAEEARYARWSRNRLAIPYSTDGPKITLGIIWFGLIAIAPSALELVTRQDRFLEIVTGVLVFVVALGAMQSARNWFEGSKAHMALAGLLSIPIVVSAAFGLTYAAGSLITVALLLMILVGGIPSESRNWAQSADVMLRSVIPIATAAAAMVSILAWEYQKGSGGAVLIALVLMVSAYEAGDFLVGSGANNSLEGPIAGIIALSVVGFGYFLLPPSAFPNSIGMLLFAGLTALACPLGQMFGSALLPNSTAWAPALRRLDSYLISAPLWFGLIVVLDF